MSFINIPAFTWISPTDTLADLPPQATLGDATLVISVGLIYWYNGTIWQPASGTFAPNYAFGTIQTPSGTYPTATVPEDTVSFTSSDSSINIVGNASTDTIDFTVASVVTSVSNSDGTLTISPTVGHVVASRPAIIGDISIPAASNTATLATVNSNIGTFNSVTVNGKGLVTAASNVTPALASISAYSVLSNNTGSSAIPIANQTLTLGTPGFSGTGVLTQFTGTNTSFLQSIWQNINNGTAASTDLVLNNDLGTNSTYYANLGINSSTFTGSGSLNLPSATYLTSTTGDLVIGSTTSNAIHFMINSGTTDSMLIDTSGKTTISSLNVSNLSASSLVWTDGSKNITSTAANQSVGVVYAGPSSGSSAAPTFRSLVSSDLPQAANLYARAATTGALTATYSNGTAGVGATLTNSGTLAAINIDGVALNATDLVFVWNQASQFQNGLYRVTTVGSGSVAWVLTRATVFDGSPGGPIYEGATFSIAQGTINYGAIFILQTYGPFVVGTTNLVFQQNIAYNTLLTGLGTSQTVIGATTSGGTLTLSSTSNATKGFIYFGNSAYDEANNRLGLGTATPATKLNIVGASGNEAIIRITPSANTASAGLEYTSFSGPTTSQGSLKLLASTGAFTLRAENSYYLNFVSSGTQAATIDTSQRFGIGQASPVARLDIADTTLAGSGSLAGSVLNLTQTWSTTGTPTAILLNVTNTASNAASKLIDLQIGSSSRFNINNTGLVTISEGTTNVTTQITDRQIGFSRASDGITSQYINSDTSQTLNIGARSIIACAVNSTVGLAIANDIGNTTQVVGVGSATGSFTAKFTVADTVLSGSGSLVGPLVNLTQTWNTTGITTAILLNVTNTASSSSSKLLDLQIGGTSKFNIRSDGRMQSTSGWQSNGGWIDWSGTGSASGSTLQGATTLNFNLASTLSQTSGFGYNFQQNVSGTTSASGTVGFVGITTNFIPTTGSAVYNVLNIVPTINQTGGANGITRGLYINPTLTAATDFRVIETTQGKIVFADTFSSGSGSLAGSLLSMTQTFNTTGTPTAIKLNVTNTASNANSKLIDLQTGGTSYFNVLVGGATLTASANGYTIASTGGSAEGGISFCGATPVAKQLVMNNNWAFITQSANSAAGTTVWTFTTNGGTTTTSSTSRLVYINDTFQAAAGSASYRPLAVEYIINNSGAQSGTATGIFLNGTETALNSMTHNLMDLQVGGSSKFKVTNGGNITAAGIVSSGNGQFNSTGGTMLFGTAGASSSASLASFANMTANGSSGNQNLFSILQTVNQSGTAGYTGILLNVTESGTGSGTKLLEDLQVGGTSQYKIAKSGKATFSSGSNKSTGTATLSSGTITVSNSEVTANSLIWVQYATGSAPSLGAGSISTLTVSAISAGTSFTITGLTSAGITNITDTSVVQWWIIN